ncbi:CII family transcriptional regulator [Thorsellia anophelis]|uniref:Bacteriophage CII protein n=1 Tax=Thorsellia anophelis DSM 18579 TaxID=1123402 RepID=A0A1I0CBZ2_9GAMM|nr:CII family transcriptional regulator [Thorsellia anophelis]SET16870.1 Bacteriophage CII protein [Thorsellia anophelis DSM 18579]
MQNANTRKTKLNNTTNLLLNRAHSSIRQNTQTQVAKNLGVADSTVLRRTEKFKEVFEVLAALGINNFVFEGERVLEESEYRILLTYAVNWLNLQKESTESTAIDPVQKLSAFPN